MAKRKACFSAEADPPTQTGERPMNETSSTSSACRGMPGFFPFRKTSHPCTLVQGCCVKCFDVPVTAQWHRSKGKGQAGFSGPSLRALQEFIGYTLHVSEVWTSHYLLVIKLWKRVAWLGKGSTSSGISRWCLVGSGAYGYIFKCSKEVIPAFGSASIHDGWDSSQTVSQMNSKSERVF